MHYEIEGTAEDLLFELESLDVHELWNNSGSTSFGYVDPDELADEMIQEVLEPFFDKWQEITNENEKQAFALELIRGLEQFKQSDSEFKDWAMYSIDEAIDELKRSQ
jgi:hypothetical protein